MLVCIRGAGDLATGIAVRLMRANFRVVMLEIPQPTTVRRTVSFSEAVRLGVCEVEGLRARLCESPSEALRVAGGEVAGVLVCPDGSAVCELRPDALVDAVLAKRNTGTKINDAPVVVGVGPGFTAGVDCHAVVETKRGHTLGRVLYAYGASAIPNTGVPGEIGGYSSERVLRCPCDGVFTPTREIGDIVEAGDIAGFVDGQAVVCAIGGMLRGLLAPGLTVKAGMKCGDVDPRGRKADYLTVSDKALAVGGGVLEALLHFLWQR
ncbi:MAG: EF2563 family selenium-dependent molybdenum hydroxylase system protein [Synergistaceae bacterium]|nr:EF2563 family selenium-dependent molybdenum hydroxylase system protein [Synergistaceae bacterium]